jgi:arylsulfatase A
MRAPTDRPNILLINCDDLGYGDLGCTGSPVHDTPAIDRLAREGALLRSFHVPAVCTPSRAALMTGCMPQRVSMADFPDNGLHPSVLFPGDPYGLSTAETTFGSVFSQAGYATACIGKWHLGDQEPVLPGRHGFADVYGLPYSNDLGPIDAWPAWPPLPVMDGDAIVERNPDLAGITGRFTERAVRFLQRHRDQPFLLYLAHIHPHVPNYAPDSFLRTSRNGRYGAAVAEIDWSVAVLRRELERLGLDRNTLIVFTSDNGSSVDPRVSSRGSNAPLSGAKGSLFEGGQRVPCIAWMPGAIPAGLVSDEPTANCDLLPTCAAWCGIPLPGDRARDGLDLGLHLRGQAPSPRQGYAYFIRNRLGAVRDRRWKLHLASGRLHDLATDLGEQHDVAAAHPGVVRALQTDADRIRADLGDSATGAVGQPRPNTRVADPRPLTRADPADPVVVALYDLDPERPGFHHRPAGNAPANAR